MKGLVLLKGDPQRTLLPLLPCEDTASSSQSATWRRALTRPCWNPDLRLPACEQYIPTVAISWAVRGILV